MNKMLQLSCHFQDQLPAEEVTKIRDLISDVRNKLANKDSMDAEEIKKTVSELQQSSLKLFEMAYKKMAADRESGSDKSGSSSSSSSSDSSKKEEKQ